MIFRLFLSLILMCSAGLSRAQLVILQYHHVDSTTPPSTSISPEDFSQHLQLLEQEGMQVVDLNDAIHKIRAGEALPEKSVAITFDDAYDSVYRNAFPQLKARQWPFTVFVNTDAVDRHYQGVMNWEQLRELQDHGGLIANHSVHHPYLIEQPAGQSLADWLTQEVAAAEQRIHEETGHSYKLLAYPYGEFNLEIAAWLQEKGYLAFGQQSGPVGPMSHPQALPRFPAAGIYASVKTLKPKLYTLAFAIPPDQLQNPVLDNAVIPPLQLTFPGVDIYPSQVQCFASGEGRIRTGSSKEGAMVRVTTQAEQLMPGGRSRYNCTAPSKSHPGWYYWYSQLWINRSVSNR